MFGFSEQSVKFTPLGQSDDCEFGVENARPLQEKLVIPKIIGLILVTGLASSLLGGLVARHFFNPNNFCIEHTSQNSPLLNDVPISFHTQVFNGTFLHENVFRRPASPEVDAAWQSLGVDYRSGLIPQEQGEQAGLTKDHVHIQKKYGGGFVVNVEGLHHLHCLNLVRQSLYYNFEYYSTRGDGAFVNEEPILRLHVSHCLDILRQQLMCTVDVGLLGQVWWNKESPTAFPDFNTKHICRKFEAVREWAFEHQAPKEVPRDWLVPPRDLSVVSEEMP